MAPKIVVLNVELQPAGGKKLLKVFLFGRFGTQISTETITNPKSFWKPKWVFLVQKKFELLLEWLRKLWC